MIEPRKQWSAIVGPVPDSRRCHQFLDEAAAIGPLRLEPADQPLRESFPIRGGLPQLGGWHEVWTFPIRVYRDSVYDEIAQPAWPVDLASAPDFMEFSMSSEWAAITQSAARELRRLCGLLSLVWDAVWVVRDMPRSVAIQIPSRLGHANPGLAQTDAAQLERTAVAAPEWVDRAWYVLDEDLIVARSLDAYAEAASIHEDHPSFALVAYVAAIEGIGQKLHAPQRCPQCRQVTESTSRFRQALSLVMSDREASELRLPSLRSETAHQGALHGPEAVVGALRDWREDTTPDHERFMQTVDTLRVATRELLSKYLQGELRLSGPETSGQR